MKPFLFLLYCFLLKILSAGSPINSTTIYWYRDEIEVKITEGFLFDEETEQLIIPYRITGEGDGAYKYDLSRVEIYGTKQEVYLAETLRGDTTNLSANQSYRLVWDIMKDVKKLDIQVTYISLYFTYTQETLEKEKQAKDLQKLKDARKKLNQRQGFFSGIQNGFRWLFALDIIFEGLAEKNWNWTWFSETNRENSTKEKRIFSEYIQTYPGGTHIKYAKNGIRLANIKEILHIVGIVLGIIGGLLADSVLLIPLGLIVAVIVLIALGFAALFGG